MKKLSIDLKKYKTKEKLLCFLSTQMDELYGMNYDALIDVFTFIKEPLQILIKNKEYYEDWNALKETLEIITKENKNIIIK